VEARFRYRLCLWKSLGRTALQTLSKRLVQTRGRSRVGCDDVWGRSRNRNVGVEPSVPHEDVEPFDLLDQEHDRPTRRCNLRARVVLESTAPPTQDLELLGVQSLIRHAASVSWRRAYVCSALAPRWPLETERLVLRPFTENEFDALHEMRFDTGVSRYLYDEPPSPSEPVYAVLAAEFHSRLPPAGPGI
jgi:hypothetical protein